MRFIAIVLLATSGLYGQTTRPRVEPRASGVAAVAVPLIVTPRTAVFTNEKLKAPVAALDVSLVVVPRPVIPVADIAVLQTEKEKGYTHSYLGQLVAIDDAADVDESMDELKSKGANGQTDAVLAAMKDAGIDVRDNREVVPLPAFFTAMQHMCGVMLRSRELKALPDLKCPVVVARFVRGSDANVKKLCDIIIASPDRKFVLFVEDDVYLKDVAKVLNNANVIAIVLGHYWQADDPAGQAGYRAALTAIKSRLAVVRKLSDKPVLLACQYGIGGKAQQWPGGFGVRVDTLFDGVAIYDLNNFAMFEITSRKKIAEQLGIPDKMPMVMLDFVGTAGDDANVRTAWQNKWGPFCKARKDEGWRGIIVITRDYNEAVFKDNVLSGTKAEYLFSK